MRAALVFVGVAAVAAGVGVACTTPTAAGECHDYKPVPACMSGTYYTCTRTDAGCEQCSCVPGTSDGRAPLPDDRR